MGNSLQVWIIAALLSVATNEPSGPWVDDFQAREASKQQSSLAVLQQRAGRGDISAQFDLAIVYDEGKGVQQDYTEAAKWFRKAADQGYAAAQFRLGDCYYLGRGVAEDFAEGYRWWRKAADQGHAEAQSMVALWYWMGPNLKGQGPPQDYAEAAKWYRKAAEQGNAGAQFSLGKMYDRGEGVQRDYEEAAKWYRKAAEHADFILATSVQLRLGQMYRDGKGVPQDYVLAHMWLNLAAGQGTVDAQRARDALGQHMTPSQLAEAQAMARNWKPGPSPARGPIDPVPTEPAVSGSGFAVASNGIIVTNNHVVEGCSRLATAANQESLRVIARDPRNDLALLQSGLTFKTWVALSENSTAKLGEAVIAAGYPLRGLVASSLNVTNGIVSALAGPDDDTQLLQTTAPVQPGSSGAPLLDLSGNLVGVIVSKLDAIRTARITGDIPQNVNFAIKTFVLRGFLESNGMAFRSARQTAPLAATEISERARQFTVAIECWK